MLQVWSVPAAFPRRLKTILTQEGLSILEEFATRNTPWDQLTEFLGRESYELPLKMTIVAVRIAYRLTKFVLKS